MKKNYLFLTAILYVFPLVMSAQGSAGGDGVCQYQIDSLALVFHLLGCILSTAVLPLLITAAVVLFILGVIKYVSKADEAKEREEGRNFMIYGIVALFVMVSIWGLVGIIQGTFGLGTNVLIPQVQGI